MENCGMSELDCILVPHLTKEEGYRKSAYKDQSGYLTIGIGRLIDERKNAGLTRDEAEYLLGNDIDERVVALWRKIPWIKSLDHVRQSILVSMAFQMGVDGLLEFKNTLKSVEEGDYGVAAARMLRSKWAKQTPKRVYRMTQAMETGEARWLI